MKKILIATNSQRILDFLVKNPGKEFCIHFFSAKPIPMNIYKHRIIVVLGFLILLLSTSCLWLQRDSPTEPPPPGTHREEFLWLDKEISVSSHAYKSYAQELQRNDTLCMDIWLLEGDYISYLFVADDENYHKWIDTKPCDITFDVSYSGGGAYCISVPTTDKYYFAVYNTIYGKTIKVKVKLFVSRWVK